jgi:hypothetical protein
MNIYRTIAAASQDDVLNGIYDIDDDNELNLLNAKRRARGMVLDQIDKFIGYAQVLQNGVCVADYFRKDK